MLKNKSKITLNSLTEDQITTISSLSGVQEFPYANKMCDYGMAYSFVGFRKN